jgi:hypothetical protein
MTALLEGVEPELAIAAWSEYLEACQSSDVDGDLYELVELIAWDQLEARLDEARAIIAT